MKKILTLLTIIVTLILTSVAVPIKANDWVYDEPAVISEETEEFVRTLNEDKFITYKAKPQLGIIIVNNLPDGYTMDEYKLEQFNLYGVGTEEENCGMLFIFAISDRKYGFEIGDGFEKGSLLRKDLEKDFITSEMKILLQEEKYDVVVRQVAEYLDQLMLEAENGIYEQREQEYLIQQQQRLQRLELLSERIDSILSIFVITLISLFGGIFSLYIIGKVIKAGIGLINTYRRKKILEELISTYYRHVRTVTPVAGPDDALLRGLMTLAGDMNPSDLEKKFLELLYELYLKCSCMELRKMGIKHSITFYEEYLEKVNNFNSFYNADIKGLDSIIYEVDEQIEKAQEIDKQNYQKIHEYIAANKNLLQEKKVPHEELEEKLQKYCQFGVPLTTDDLVEAFEKEFKEFAFRYEYERFIGENKENIVPTYFASSEFYDTLRNSTEYNTYNYNTSYDRNWMLPFLFLHMENRKAEIEQKKERQLRAEIRRKEEQARRAKEEKAQDISNSFGSSFDGGYSSGGGFSGGW